MSEQRAIASAIALQCPRQSCRKATNADEQGGAGGAAAEVRDLKTLLVLALLVNAALGLGYRAYRYSKGGPIADVWGQAVLAVLLAGIAFGVGNDVGWLRWGALAYALVYAAIAMPIWILGVLIPLPPGAIDYTFTVVYYLGLVLVAVAAIGS